MRQCRVRSWRRALVARQATFSPTQVVAMPNAWLPMAMPDKEQARVDQRAQLAAGQGGVDKKAHDLGNDQPQADVGKSSRLSSSACGHCGLR